MNILTLKKKKYISNTWSLKLLYDSFIINAISYIFFNTHTHTYSNFKIRLLRKKIKISQLNIWFGLLVNLFVWTIVEKCYFYQIFTTNPSWQLIVIGSNLHITEIVFLFTDNNLLIRICCENVLNITFFAIF